MDNIKLSTITTRCPVVVFAFNRRNALENMMRSLMLNPEAKETDLYIFVDGPRPDKVGEKEKVQAVRNYVLFNIPSSAFHSVNYTFSEINKGLAPSIISGVTEIINKYGRVIVVEDDLILSRSFLRYMNEMLDRFEGDQRVMQVSGFGTKLSKGSGYKWDIYLNERAHSWTWGTWKDRWETIDWDVKDFENLRGSRRLQKAFCKRGSDLYEMLKGYMEGKNKSWYIRFNYSMYKQHKYAVCPVRSLVLNNGFTSEATNCKTYNRYKVDFEELHVGAFRCPNRMEPDEKIIRNSVRFWSIRYRIFGRLMTSLINLK